MAQEPTTGKNGATARPANEIPIGPFVLSLIAGLLMLASVGMMMTFTSGTPYYGMMGGYYGMMNGYYGMMQGFGSSGWFYGFAVLGLVAGIVVLVGAVMIYARPNQASTWGLLILIFSVISFFGMGGFFVGAILGVVGGILAMVWRPSVTSR